MEVFAFMSMPETPVYEYDCMILLDYKIRRTRKLPLIALVTSETSIEQIS